MRQGWIIMFAKGDDFMHKIFPSFADALNLLINQGLATSDGSHYYIVADYNIEQVTVH